MPLKRLLLTSLALFICKAAVGALMFGLVFGKVYDAPGPAFRPDDQQNHAMGALGELAWALAFAYIFIRGHEGRGWLEGVRFGLVAWVAYFVPMTMGIWTYFAVSTDWAFAGLVGGLIESVACGIAAALVNRRRPDIRPAR